MLEGAYQADDGRVRRSRQGRRDRRACIPGLRRLSFHRWVDGDLTLEGLRIIWDRTVARQAISGRRQIGGNIE